MKFQIVYFLSLYLLLFIEGGPK